MNRHPQGQLSRADLLEALVAADNQAVEYLTRQLGLSLYVEPIFTKPAPELENQTLPKPKKDDLPTSLPETTNQPVSGVWKLDKREDTPQQAWPEIITQQEPINSPPLIAEPPKHYPLTSPRSLLARLFHQLKHQQDSRDIDVEAIVKKLSRGEHLTVLPKTHRRSLGKHLHLIDDRQLHLTPYWRDHTLFASLFEALLPDYASSRAVLQSGHPLPYSYIDSGYLTDWQLPPEGSVVLVFSDLGALAQHADNLIATWLQIARTLVKRHCKLIALVPCHPDECDVRLKPMFNIESWETQQHLTPCPPAQRHNQAEQLLTLLAPAIRLEPSLLRQLRVNLAKHNVHIHAAVESLVWQHPDMQEHSSVAATINSDARCNKWLSRFQAETSELQQTALDILRTWRTRLLPEIWYEEIVSLDKVSSTLIPEQDLQAAQHYFWQLLRRDESGYQLTADDDTVAWLRRLEKRLPNTACDSPEIGTVLQEILVQLHMDEEGTLNHSIDPTLLSPTNLPERTAGLYQINQQLVIAPLNSTDPELTKQNQLATIRYKRPLLYIKTEENKGISFMFPADLQQRRVVCDFSDAHTLIIRSDQDSLAFQLIPTIERPLKLFISYNHKDKTLFDKLTTYLILLERQKIIEGWFDRKIDAGVEWRDVIDDNLEAADIIVLLVSADFIASDYLHSKEMKIALQKHQERSAVIIPVLLRPCDTYGQKFMQFQILPKNLKPVTKWDHLDEALIDIILGIRSVAENILNVNKYYQSGTHNNPSKYLFIESLYPANITKENSQKLKATKKTIANYNFPKLGYLKSQYIELIAEKYIQYDEQQFQLLEHLQNLLNEIANYIGYQHKYSLRNKLSSLHRSCESLYIYGDVGRGKSMLMDMFYEACPIKEKRRVHFNSFMIEVHDFIHHHSKQKSSTDVISALAKQIRINTLVLCFDEFHVTDIADAMIIGRLFIKMFEQGIIAVITSNRNPIQLYQGGLQREQFLFFISVLNKYTKIVQLNTKNDYRQRSLLSSQKGYIYPLDEYADEFIWRNYNELTGSTKIKPGTLEVLGLTLLLTSVHEDILLSSFDELCGKPLGSAAYLAIARKFSVVILANIPRLNFNNRNEAKRFVTLIDMLYEHKVKLLCSAEVSAEELYKEGDGSFEFRRTVSRLIEMQSDNYLIPKPFKEMPKSEFFEVISKSKFTRIFERKNVFSK